MGVLAEVHAVAAGSGGHIVDVAGVEDDVTNGENVGCGGLVVIEQTGLEMSDSAIDELHSSKGGGTAGIVHKVVVYFSVVEDDVFADDIHSGCADRRYVEVTGHHGHTAVGTDFTNDMDAGGGLGCTKGIGRAGELQVDFTTGGYVGNQSLAGGDFRQGAGIGHSPYIHGTAGGAQIVENHLVLGGGCKAGNRCGTGVLVGILKVVLDLGATLHGACLDMGNLLEIGHVRAPLQGNGVSRTGSNLHEEVILHGICGGVTVIDRPVRCLAGLGQGLHLEVVFLIGGKTHGVGNIGRKDSLVQDLYGHGLVGIDHEVVRIGILVHIPAEGDIVARGHIDLYRQVLGFKAAGEVDFGNLLERFLYAACKHGCGCERYNGGFEYVNSFHSHYRLS